MRIFLLSLIFCSFAFCVYAQKKAIICSGDKDIVSMWELDPHEDIPIHLDDIRRQIYDTLYELDITGEPRESLLEQCLVDSYSEDVTSNAEMQINCKLRPNVFFHDGNPLTTEDIIFSIRRIKSSRTLSSTLDMIKDVRISGQNQIKFIIKYGVAGVDSPNKWLFERFKRILARTSYIVRQKYMEDAGSWAIEYPVGTGPFYFKDWKIWDKKDSRSQIMLYKNKSYWRKPYPRIDELFFRFMPAKLVYRDILNGSLALAYRLPFTDYKMLKDKDLGKGKYKTSKRLIYSYQYVLFNPESKYFSFPDLKNAFLGGIDKTRISKLVFDNSVMVNTGRTLYASSVFPERFQTRPYKPFDSKNTVTEFLKSLGAKKSGKIPLNMLVPDLPEQISVAQEMMKQLYAAGFLLRIKKFPYSKYMSIINKGDLEGYDLFMYSVDENPVFSTPQKMAILANGGIQLYQRYVLYSMARPENGGLKNFTPSVEGAMDLKNAE